ncbi:right-handed parallel beta-helix repeat-containing protein [Sphingomonas parva]|uniref:Right-handed parallel beta-helix repeat-containing protein n=1 Tax=Sphingomonas parva TaxID=2555898 RepID=A0A4Y8ZSN0_9SPHN|nr:right-handed parallel beta-helix repeat-containing protein [Sphingomonas parva]TFI59030.1 right-handed parallel beta-helix repeat-containing protein [Sphingomonas parva]
MPVPARPLIAAGAAFAVLNAAPVLAQGAAPFSIYETGQRFGSLQEAVAAIGDGDGTIYIAPGRYRECAVQEAGRIAYVADERGKAVFDGTMCEGKAALVLRGREAHVEGLVFTNARVPDGNGAGIRIEQGNLSVAWTVFSNGQCGILSANDGGSRITIDHATFSGLGKHPDGTGAHALYIGEYGALKVTNSRFERGTGGHYLKSRAPQIEVIGNSFDDSQGSATNYMIDLSGGATGRIARNTFVNGRGKENYSTMIAVAAEGKAHSSDGLVIEDNDVSLAPGVTYETAFVGDWAGDRLVVRNNRLGRGVSGVEGR